MREIKFRAWDIDYQKWIENFYIHCYSLYINDGYAFIKKGKFILEQYTGLKDKNGKEIYEGDIFLSNLDITDKKRKVIGVVYFGSYADDEKYTTKSHLGWFIEYTDSFGKSTNSLDDICNELKIIGNIHENHELLEKI